jgi:hypothetical protein
LCASWLFGSLAITAIIVMESMGSPYAAYAYCAWAAAFAAGTYVALSFALNRTTVSVDSGKLVIRSGPLAWGWSGANSTTSVGEVSELAVESYMTMGFLGPGGRLFRISARTLNGKSVPLVAYAMIGKGDRADAEDLAHRIEGMLQRGTA